MSLVLYHSGLTTCSKQVRQCLREKELPYVSRFVELWRYENLSPSYLSINPNGVVPTLIHNGTPIINSFCIMEYIEDAFPQRPLRPRDPVEAARSRYWAWTADEVHLMLARLTHMFMLRAKVQGLSEADQRTMLEHTPVPEKRERWAILTTKEGYSDTQIQSARQSVGYKLSMMEKELAARGPWVAGATFSLGDIAMLAIYHRVLELFPDDIQQKDFPKLSDWWNRAMERPATKLVYTDGLEETPVRPRGKNIEGIFDYQI